MPEPNHLRNPYLEGSAFYWRAGPTGVILCHGFTATTAEVRLLAQSLLDDGYTIAAPLLPGHGTTPQDCNRHSWQDWYAAARQSYLELARQCEKVVIGGESAGALLALRLAVDYPDAAAVLCYAPALRLQLRRSTGLLMSVLAPFVTSVPKPQATDDIPWQGYSVWPLKGALQLTRLQQAVVGLLPRIHQPVLILQGRLDPTVHPQAPQVIYDRVASPIKELYWLDQSAHCVILDKQHDLAASLTADFLLRVLS
jgi:carboxylesterase